MSWNYRMATRLIPKTEAHPEWRWFGVVEVFYDEGVPNLYGDELTVGDYGTLEDLKTFIASLQKVVEKDEPLLDLDNWPDVWKE